MSVVLSRTSVLKLEGVNLSERAAAGRHQSGVAQLAQVVRDEVLRRTDELRELADAPVTLRQVGQQRPAVPVAEDLQELPCTVRRLHECDGTST